MVGWWRDLGKLGILDGPGSSAGYRLLEPQVVLLHREC